MDKRFVGAAIVVIVGFLLFAKTPLLSFLFAFIILGLIPGTSLAVPFWVTLVIYPLIFLLAIIWLGRQSFFIGAPKQPEHKVTTAHKKTQKKPVASARSKRVAAKRRPRTAT